MATKKQAPTSETLEKGGKKMQPVYAKGEMQKAKKAFPPEGGDDDKEDEDEDEEKENPFAKTKKSMDLSEDDLQKSLDKLGEIATAGSPVSRKDALLKKSLEGEDLSKGEKAELFKLLGGEVEEPETPALSKSVEETFTENDVLQKAVDVSDYLDENQKALIKSLGILSDRVEADGTRQHEFNLVLAKAMSGVGKLVKSMSERLGVIESQPARGPKSAGVKPGQVLHKGFGGQPATEDQLNQSQVLDGLEQLMQKSMSEGRGGFSEGNENITLATAKFESSRQITPSLLTEIRRLNQSGTQH